MADTQLTTIQITKISSAKLGEIAEALKRSKTQQVEFWIDETHRRMFNVVGFSELPHPAGAEPVPVVEVALLAEEPE